MVRLYNKYGWWLIQMVFLIASTAFLILGVMILVASYRMQDPFTFLMLFFASNFIILISGALVFVFLYRMYAVYQKLRSDS